MNGSNLRVVFANFSCQESAHQASHVEGLPATSFLLLKNEPEGWAWLCASGPLILDCRLVCQFGNAAGRGEWGD
jgi:hypothetical protein